MIIKWDYLECDSYKPGDMVTFQDTQLVTLKFIDGKYYAKEWPSYGKISGMALFLKRELVNKIWIKDVNGHSEKEFTFPVEIFLFMTNNKKIKGIIRV